MTDNDARWYAVMTAPQKEIVAARGLRQRGYAVCCPMRLKRQQHVRRGQRGMVVRQARVWLPGYLFARIGPQQSFMRVNETPHVSTLVYVGDEPRPICDEEIDELRSFLRSQAKTKTVRVVLFEPGQKVEWIDGPYVGYEGTVIIDKGTKISVDCRKISANPVTVTKRETLRPLDSAQRVA